MLVGELSEKNTHKYSGSDEYTTKSTTFEFGLRPVMGLECHFLSNFFVGAECGYDILFNNKKHKNEGGETSVTSKNTVLNICDLATFMVRIGFNF